MNTKQTNTNFFSADQQFQEIKSVISYWSSVIGH